MLYIYEKDKEEEAELMRRYWKEKENTQCNAILKECYKRDAENPILNKLTKNTSAIFSAFKKPTGTCLQSQL